MQVWNWEVKSQSDLKLAVDTQVNKEGFCKFISCKEEGKQMDKQKP